MTAQVIASEVQAPLSREAAATLTESIRQATTRALDALSDVERDVQAAYRGRAWIALGYLSWEEYCAQEFSGARLWASVEERNERTRKLHEVGLSQRAIAAVLDVDQATVRRAVSSEASASVDRAVQGLDGRVRPARRSEDAQLFARRLEVLRLRSSGMPQEAVAARLRVSQATVSTDEKYIGNLLGEVSEDVAEDIARTIEQGAPDLDAIATTLGIDTLYNRFSLSDVVVDTATSKAKELRRVARALHDEAIFNDDVLVTDEGCLRKSSQGALPALVEAVQTAVRCMLPLDASALDDKARLRVVEQVDQATRELRQWRERSG